MLSDSVSVFVVVPVSGVKSSFLLISAFTHPGSFPQEKEQKDYHYKFYGDRAVESEIPSGSEEVVFELERHEAKVQEHHCRKPNVYFAFHSCGGAVFGLSLSWSLKCLNSDSSGRKVPEVSLSYMRMQAVASSDA